MIIGKNVVAFHSVGPRFKSKFPEIIFLVRFWYNDFKF